MESQEKNTLADIIRKRMDSLKLNQEALAQLSGVRQPVISRLVNGGANIGTDNIFALLKALNLLNDINTLCSVQCDKELREICAKVKEIMDSKTHWWTSLEQNINSFHKGMESDRGSTSGTQKPARRTGLKKKAG